MVSFLLILHFSYTNHVCLWEKVVHDDDDGGGGGGGVQLGVSLCRHRGKNLSLSHSLLVPRPPSFFYSVVEGRL